MSKMLFLNSLWKPETQILLEISAYKYRSWISLRCILLRCNKGIIPNSEQETANENHRLTVCFQWRKLNQEYHEGTPHKNNNNNNRKPPDRRLILAMILNSSWLLEMLFSDSFWVIFHSVSRWASTDTIDDSKLELQYFEYFLLQSPPQDGRPSTTG